MIKVSLDYNGRVRELEEKNGMTNAEAQSKATDEVVSSELLIMASKDLLEACKLAQVRIFMLDGSENETYKMLGKVIAKAEGGK